MATAHVQYQTQIFLVTAREGADAHESILVALKAGGAVTAAENLGPDDLLVVALERNQTIARGDRLLSSRAYRAEIRGRGGPGKQGVHHCLLRNRGPGACVLPPA